MNKLTVNKLEKIADRFCESMKTKYPDIWWCFGNSDEFRILFYICKWSESENAKPIWKLNSEGIISTICVNIPYGSYICYEIIPELNICVDKCLVDEIKELNQLGIKTIGCCCGHGKSNGFIQVQKKYVSIMKELGYTQLLVDANGNGKWCFEPKSIRSDRHAFTRQQRTSGSLRSESVYKRVHCGGIQ